nr:CatA-like O-acetyltransferase [Paenibacillus dendritiformis]
MLPIVTSGKYFEQDGHTLLPVCLQVHHALPSSS